MIVETVITSVPRGLKAGRTGYQPVMRTRGLRDDVLRQLEPLTGYRHIHRQGSGKNPVNYTYRRLASNVGDLAVIGRTVDAGSDFSNRSNKCGHLIAFTADEIGRLSRTTPAALLADNAGLFASQWTKGPEERPAPPALAEQPQTPAMCTTWQSQFGDAGWAAVVAERARRRQPTLLVAPDSSPQSSELLLRLIREATALLPPADRWAVSFETTVLGASDALIQGTYRGSPEAEATRQGVLVLPLGGPVPPGALQENDLCKIARFGPPQPVAATPPPVALTATKPIAGEDFLSKAPTSEGPNSQPPSLPVPASDGNAPFIPVHQAENPSRSYLSTIIPVAVILLVLFILVGYFLVVNHDLFLPRPSPENDKRGQNPLTAGNPEDVLNKYLTDFHKEPRPEDLSEPSLEAWQTWLKARGAEEKINKDWVSYANAILRLCTPVDADPFAREWKQKERNFYDAVQHISQLEPTASDLNFLLCATNLTESNAADAFTKAALNAHEKNYSKKEKPNPEKIIDTAIQANKLHETLRGFLSKKPQNAAPEDKQLAELVSDYSKATWLPSINGDKNGQQTKFFLLSLRNQTANSDTRATAPTFDELASFAKEFNKARSDLEAYAKSLSNQPTEAEPNANIYEIAYGRKPQQEGKDLTVQALNTALRAIGTVPDTLQPILDAARLIKEWDKLRNNFGKHKYDPAKRKIVLAEGLNFPSGSRGKIKPIFFATTTVASEGSNCWNFLLNEEPSCTVKWEEDGTKLVAEFKMTPMAEILLRLPLVIELDSKLNNIIDKKTEPERIIDEHFQFATSADPNLTIAAFAESGGVEYVQIAGSQQSNTAATLADLVAVVEHPHLRWDTSYGSQKENPPNYRIEQNSLASLSGHIKFQYETPTEKKPGQPTSESLNDLIAYTFEPELTKLKFEFTGTIDLSRLTPDRKLTSTRRSLKGNSVDISNFSDIAHAVYSASAGDSKMRLPELNTVLIEIVSDHAFGVHEKDFFGETPLYGKNDNREMLFRNNNFSDPANPGASQGRALLGKAGVESLEKRSWEMALASYLIKHSSKFSEKAKLRAAKEKEIKDIEKELEKLNKDPEKNKQSIDEQKETIGGKQKEKRQIDDWFLSGWVQEDLGAIAASVRREAAKKQSDERRRTEIAARLFLNLRPFLARYLLTNDEELKNIPLASLLSTKIWFQPESDNFGKKFLLAVINPSPLANNTVPPKASDEETSRDITDQQP